MEKRMLVKPQIEEYNNFEVYDQEDASSGYSGEVIELITACINLIAAIIAACS